MVEESQIESDAWQENNDEWNGVHDDGDYAAVYEVVFDDEAEKVVSLVKYMEAGLELNRSRTEWDYDDLDFDPTEDHVDADKWAIAHIMADPVVDIEAARDQ